MARFALLLLALTSGFVLAAPVPKPKVKDEEAMRGKWKVVDLQHDGKPANQDYKEGVATIDKDKFSVQAGGEGKARDEVMGYKLDAGKKEIDLTPPQGNPDAAVKGLYELDGDTLTIAIGMGNPGVRPTEVKPGTGIAFIKLQRMKEEKK